MYDYNHHRKLRDLLYEKIPVWGREMEGQENHPKASYKGKDGGKDITS